MPIKLIEYAVGVGRVLIGKNPYKLKKEELSDMKDNLFNRSDQFLFFQDKIDVTLESREVLQKYLDMQVGIIDTDPKLQEISEQLMISKT